jgi:hypothetical protein
MQCATESLILSLLKEWAEAGLLQPSGSTLAVAPSHQPLPVRIQYSADLAPVYYLSHVEDARLSQLPQSIWEGPTHVVASYKDASDVVNSILRNARDQQVQGGDPKERVLGFDVEFKPRWNASLPESPPTVVQVWCSLVSLCLVVVWCVCLCTQSVLFMIV